MQIRANQIEKRSWVEVDMSQLLRNYDSYKRALKKDARIMAVIKADAYGHGDVQVARLLSDVGVDLFAVSNIDEAIGLREAGIKGEILILGYSSPFYAKALYDYDLTQAIVSAEYARQLKDTGIRIKCQIAIDTGMNRIGLWGSDPLACGQAIREISSALNVNGLFTHLCVADSNDKYDVEFTKKQIARFHSVVDSVADLNLQYVHCCNSAAGLRYLDDSPYYDRIGQIVRLGILLYGLVPSNDVVAPKDIKPALTWKSVLSMVKTVNIGETIGYGRTFTASRQSRIATMATGYADGLSRCLSNKGYVLINGARAPIVGNICMDQTMLDVTDIAGVEMGMHAVIIGESRGLSITPDDLAGQLGTIGYEVLCDISKRVQRFYFNANRFL